MVWAGGAVFRRFCVQQRSPLFRLDANRNQMRRWSECRRPRRPRVPGFFAKYGAAVALALSALIVISASAAFFMFTGAVQDEADAAASETVASFRDAIAYEAASRIGDLTETLAAATGYVETNGGAPGDEEVTAGLNAMGTRRCPSSYESPDKLAGMSEYLGESRERLRKSSQAAGLRAF